MSIAEAPATKVVIRPMDELAVERSKNIDRVNSEQVAKMKERSVEAHHGLDSRIYLIDFRGGSIGILKAETIEQKRVVEDGKARHVDVVKPATMMILDSHGFQIAYCIPCGVSGDKNLHPGQDRVSAMNGDDMAWFDKTFTQTLPKTDSDDRRRPSDFSDRHIVMLKDYNVEPGGKASNAWEKSDDDLRLAVSPEITNITYLSVNDMRSASNVPDATSLDKAREKVWPLLEGILKGEVPKASDKMQLIAEYRAQKGMRTI